MTFEEVVAEYGITHQDILACLNYAARSVSEERIFPLEHESLAVYA